MIVYECFSTGSKTGFIEVIRDAFTIFKIQVEGGIKGRYQFDSIELFRWICSNNANEKFYTQEINTISKAFNNMILICFID